ncbi:MAG: hypothetical protein HY051_01130, partial [Candidatus Aenigmarchaeota archaeon]|nr:hypothetical protein [Candidatus Aenigmarchaeota archaeon]
KTIESRWYKHRRTPWNKIKKGDTVYFKNSGEPVSIKTRVKKVMQFSGLSPQKTMEILDRYGKADGIEEQDFKKFHEMFKDKNYCVLVFLEKPEKAEPFNIDKKGFGAMASWITVDNIAKIKSN